MAVNTDNKRRQFALSAAKYKELERTTDRLTRLETAEALEILSAQFEIPCPTLRWSERAKNGRSYYGSWAIALGPLVWRGTTNSLLHEFAHLLAFYRHKAVIYRGPLAPHGREFLRALIDTAEVWHGDPRRYAWLSEYKALAVAGPKEITKLGKLNALAD